MKYRLLALDIDGTLIGSEERVSAEVVAALHAAVRAGIGVCLATGRSYAETMPIWRQLDLPEELPLVLVSGALVSEPATGRTLYQRTMDRPAACDFSDGVAAAGYCAVAAVDPWRHGVSFFRTTGGNHEALIQRWMSRRPVQVRTAEKMAQHADMPDPLRVSTILERPQPELLADLQRRFEGRLTMQTIFVPAYGLTVLEAFSTARASTRR